MDINKLYTGIIISCSANTSKKQKRCRYFKPQNRQHFRIETCRFRKMGFPFTCTCEEAVKETLEGKVG